MVSFPPVTGIDTNGPGSLLWPVRAPMKPENPPSRVPLLPRMIAFSYILFAGEKKVMGWLQTPLVSFPAVLFDVLHNLGPDEVYPAPLFVAG